MDQLWAENAVIRKETSSMVEYSGRCPKCGHVNNSRVTTGANGFSRGGTHSYGTCEKCREHYKIVIGRG